MTTVQSRLSDCFRRCAKYFFRRCYLSKKYSIEIVERKTVYRETHIMKNLAKIMEKYTRPNIPTTQAVLEDLFDDEILQVKDHPIKLADGNESLLNAHSCFKNFKQLQEDLMKQDELKSKLDELNKKLVENIANMKQ